MTKINKSKYPILTEREIKVIIESCGGKYRLRNKLAIQILRDSGISLKELSLLHTSDVSPRLGGILRIRQGKNLREVKLQDDTISTLKEYLLRFKPGALLLSSRKGGGLSPRGIQKMLEKTLDISGVTKYKKVSAKTFRDTYIVNSMKNFGIFKTRTDLNLKCMPTILASEKIQKKIGKTGLRLTYKGHKKLS